MPGAPSPIHRQLSRCRGTGSLRQQGSQDPRSSHKIIAPPEEYHRPNSCAPTVVLPLLRLMPGLQAT